MTANIIKGASRWAVATLVALLATALTLLALASPARAETITVDNGYDPGDGTCNSDGCTLREAISAAAPGDTVKFAPSVPGTILLRDGHLEIDKNLKIEGPGADKLTVSGNEKSRVFKIESSTAAEISGLTIADGRATTVGDIQGGGILSHGSLKLRNVALESNLSNGYGAAIYGLGTLDLIGTTVSENKTYAGSAGGISGAGKLMIINSTISNNSAGEIGGIWWNGTEARYVNSTISGNTGHNLYMSNARTEHHFENTLIADPTESDHVSSEDAQNCRLVTGAKVISGRNNLDSDGSCGLSQSSDINNKDPKLDPLAANGGTTKTHKLLSGSPAIDNGSNCLAKDQRGTTRPQDGDRNGSYKCDIGSFELEGPPPDTAKPIINGLSPKPGASTRDRTPTIGATIRDNATDLQKSNIKLYLDGKLKTAFSYDRNTDRLSYTAGRLANKRHLVRIVATDDANNTSARTWRFTVDAAKPSIGRLSPRPGAKTFDRTPTIRATVKDNATNLRKGNIKLYVDGRRKTNFLYNARRDKLVYKSSRLSYKRHTVKIVAKDAAGNVAKRSWRFTVKKR